MRETVANMGRIVFFFVWMGKKSIANGGEKNEVSPDTEKFVKKSILFFKEATL